MLTFSNISARGEISVLQSHDAGTMLLEIARTKIDALKEIIRTWGLNPEEILTREALTQPHRTIIDRSQHEQVQLNQLTNAFWEQMLKEMREKV